MSRLRTTRSAELPADTPGVTFRIQGPALFVDFNDSRSEQAHIHTFYLSYVNDFGPTVPR